MSQIPFTLIKKSRTLGVLLLSVLTVGMVSGQEIQTGEKADPLSQAGLQLASGNASAVSSGQSVSLGERVAAENEVMVPTTDIPIFADDVRPVVAASSVALEAPEEKAPENKVSKEKAAPESAVATVPVVEEDSIEVKPMAESSAPVSSGAMSASTPSSSAANVGAWTTGAAVGAAAVASNSLEPEAVEEFATDEEEEPLIIPHAAFSDAIGVGMGVGGRDTLYEFDTEEGEFDNAAYRRYFDERFVKPGFADGRSDMVPFRAIDRLIEGFVFTTEAGLGYDSNALLSDGGYSSPTFDDTGNRGGWVSWFRLGISYSNGIDTDSGRRIVFGFDLGGDIVAYEKGTQEYGRGNVEPYISPYVGYVGGRTTIMLRPRYYLSEGNNLYGTELNREAPFAKSQRYGASLSVSRQMNHGTLAWLIDYDVTEFDGETGLNDQSSVITNLSYLYHPPSMPKTGIGPNVRYGVYDTDRNPDEYFLEPGIALSYQATSKTSLDGRIGYAFRWYDNESTIGENGRWTYAMGANWLATERIRFRVEGFRDFRPSYVSDGESFNNDGVRLQMNYAMPWWRLHFGTWASFEKANYYGTAVPSTSIGRSDNFFRYGATIGRPINLINWFDTSISIFYDYTENDSNRSLDSYNRHFGGIRVTGTL